MNCNSTNPVRALLAAFMLAALAACGGGSDDPGVPVTPTTPPAAAASSPVGPGQVAAVTIAGPNGAAVTVPAGAASAPVAIVMAQAGAGTPALPASAVLASAVYEVTPHGHGFDKAVDIAVPFDAATIPAGERPILLKAEQGGDWAAITDVRVDGGMLHALVADFSYFAVVSCGSYSIVTCTTEPMLAVKVAAPSISSAANAVIAPPPAGSAFDLAGVVKRYSNILFEVQLSVPAGCLHPASRLALVLSSNQGLIGITREPAQQPLSPVMTLAYTGKDDLFVARRTRMVGTQLMVDLTAFYGLLPGTAGYDETVLSATSTCYMGGNNSVNLQSAPLRLSSDRAAVGASQAVPFDILEAPADQTVAVGQTALFSVTAPIASLVAFQWERSDDGGASWVILTGERASYYQLFNARPDDNGARFRAIVTERPGGSTPVFVSAAATLTVSATSPIVDPDAATPWQADSLIAAGGSAAFLVRNDNTLLSWGANNGGVLGRASAADGTPQPLALAGVRSVVSGAWYASALLANGDVYAWGWGGNVGAAIGSSATDNPLPVKVTGLANIRALSTRYQHTLALAANGDVYGFGPESSGALGPAIGNDGVRQIAGLADVRQVAAGEAHSLALLSDGTVWAWGSNSAGQLGALTDSTTQATPVQVTGLANIVAIAASSFGSFAVRRDGTVWSWGQATLLGRTGDTATALQVATLSSIVSLGAGNYNAFAIDSSGKVFGWGDNTAGRVGVVSTATIIDVPTPLPHSPVGSGTTQVIGGETMGLWLTRDGEVWAWGSNAFGGLGAPVDGVARPDSTVAVDAGVGR
jgi:alpha-tubulin suppressor-like RCC1 family protein